MAYYLDCGPVAHASELKFFQIMKEKLPAEWIVMGNVTRSMKILSKEFDAVILAPGRLWGVEIKAWHGKIAVDDEYWTCLSSSEKRSSPLKSITSACRQYLIPPARDLGVWAGGIVVMMEGTAGDLQWPGPDHEHDGRDRVVYIDDAVSWLNKASRGRRMPAADRVQRFILEMAGKRALEAYRVGGDLVPQACNAPVSRLHVMLSQGDFVRHYYGEDCSRLLLGKEELRGASPAYWRNWRSEGAYIDFTDHGVVLEALPGTSLEINGRIVQAGMRYPLDVIRGNISIGGISLSYEISTD